MSIITSEVTYTFDEKIPHDNQLIRVFSAPLERWLDAVAIVKGGHILLQLDEDDISSKEEVGSIFVKWKPDYIVADEK